MNDAMLWLYRQFHTDSLPETPYRCYLCGRWHGEECYPVAKGIPDTFNSHYLAQSPSSPWLCRACSWYLDNRIGHPEFRKMSLIVSHDSWQNWQRDTMKADIVRWLRDGLDEDAYLVVSLSKKKHILLQANQNTRTSTYLSIQVEEQVAYLTRSIWERIESSFMRLLAMGHNKGEILSGNLYANTIRKHGQIREALMLNEDLARWRNSPQIELVSYVTVIEKEETHESTADRDGNDSSRVTAPESRLDANRPGVQSEVPHGHLATSRKQRQGVRHDEQHAEQVSQQSLF